MASRVRTSDEDIRRLLKSETWVADLVKLLASASCQFGHSNFASDVKRVRLIVDEAFDEFTLSVRDARNLAKRYPTLFEQGPAS